MTTYDTDLKKSVADSTFRDAALFGIEASGATVLFGKSALRLPVAISDAPGGRASIHDMSESQPTLTGVYVVDQQIVKELLTRTGEISYKAELASRDGQSLFEGTGSLEMINPEFGHSKIVFHGKYKQWAPTLLGLDADAPAQWERVSFGWSCVAL
ncbi:hypothetical protein SAMN05428944_5492 [Streptomyces sp. 1222.5]|uniref:hypothetical protein n=1 Tax=unclassified Streptomyces TaxID=2593676 RepID=UPI00089B0376|nr:MULTISPECIES: hypothetical protein [unclassified Streptomyces]PKW07439.1 hypothetical protein BX260_2604 [Streptomyces sp. 5112.2]SEC88850.1 hypothetical protein SAMN05428944_5492 [Streptomyces sp. 1222.5]